MSEKTNKTKEFAEKVRSEHTQVLRKKNNRRKEGLKCGMETAMESRAKVEKEVSMRASGTSPSTTNGGVEEEKKKKEEKRVPFTHFVSVPLVDEEMVKGFMRIQLQYQELLQNEKMGFTPRMVLSPNRTHLTCFLLSLTTEEDKKKAVSIFQDAADEVKSTLGVGDLSQSNRFRLSVNGIACMDKNLSKARVIYAQPDEDDSLNKLFEAVRLLALRFHKEGLLPEAVIKQQRLFSNPSSPHDSKMNVKWHMTLVNAKYAKGKKRRTFDATALMSAASSHPFGEAVVETIELSNMTVPGDMKARYYYPSDSTIVL